MPDEREQRKRAAAAQHAQRVAELADEAVAKAEAKVAKGRDELGAARDALAAAQQAAKEAHREADERQVDLAEIAPGAEVSVAAQVAAATGKTRA